MKLALLQLNPTVGDFSGNAERILRACAQAFEQGATLAVTSELALTGYPPRDLLLRDQFIHSSLESLQHIAQSLEPNMELLLGLPTWNESGKGRRLYNSVAWIKNRRVECVHHKTLLPTYDVFDEDRYFEPAVGHPPSIINTHGLRVGLSICEDIWNDRDFWKRQRYAVDPVEHLVEHGIDVLVNLSASPFHVGKQELRESMLASMAKRHAVPIAYVNQVGGNDDLVFDGRSAVLDARGQLIGRAKGFEEHVLVVELGKQAQGSIAQEDVTPEAELWQALVLGTRDYVHKCSFTSVLLGLSGGIDSALTAAIAVDAVGRENVLGVLLPSPYSSQGSLDDAHALVKNLGIRSHTIPIGGLMNGFEQALHQAFEGYPQDVTEENVQSRIRGNLLMALSNKYRSLLLTTGNKSELAVGYCTIYGDMSGGLAVIADVPKTMVYRLAHWCNREKEIIPPNSIHKAPSAELRPNQKDQDSLPDYEVLDRILQQHIEHNKTVEEIVAKGEDETVVRHILRLVKLAEFKRKQAAPGLRVTDRAFGTGWRVPIASKA